MVWKPRQEIVKGAKHDGGKTVKEGRKRARRESRDGGRNGRKEGRKQAGKEDSLCFCVLFIVFPPDGCPPCRGGRAACGGRAPGAVAFCRKAPLPRRSRRGRGTCGFAALAFRHMCPAHGQEAPMIFLCFPLFFFAAPRAADASGRAFPAAGLLGRVPTDAAGRAGAWRRSVRGACAGARPRVVFLCVCVCVCVRVFCLPSLVVAAPVLHALRGGRFRRQGSLPASLQMRRGELRLRGARCVGCAPGAASGRLLFFCILFLIVSSSRSPCPRPYRCGEESCGSVVLVPSCRCASCDCFFLSVCCSSLLRAVLGHFLSSLRDGWQCSVASSF